MTPTSIEYGVRRYGGHVTPCLSRHVAEREVGKARDAGEKNVWMVQRVVEDWHRPE